MAELFSRRNKHIAIKEIQLNGMDSDLRNGLWNALHAFYKEVFFSTSNRKYFYNESLRSNLWIFYFKERADHYTLAKLIRRIEQTFMVKEYFRVFDCLEYLLSLPSVDIDVNAFAVAINAVLKEENSGFTLVRGMFVPITSENEIQSINEAIENSIEYKLNGVKGHLEMSLKMMSDRQNPDYRNSIKESISAVESLCRMLSESDKDELGKALDKVNQKLQMHGALKEGFKKIYGYTSDGDGIRHSMMEESNLDKEDALFMLVSCSAFINYLTAKGVKAGIL